MPPPEEVSTLLHASLIVTNPSTLDPEPRLFANWQQDNPTYIFTLHEDAVWSDGETDYVRRHCLYRAGCLPSRLYRAVLLASLAM